MATQISASPSAELDLDVKVGGPCDIYLTYTIDGIAVDITGWSVRSDWVLSQDNLSPIVVNGTVTDGPNGVFRYYLSAANVKTAYAAAVAAGQRYMLYDIFLLPPAGEPDIAVYGKILFVPNRTAV
jgi:hypothetical protein